MTGTTDCATGNGAGGDTAVKSVSLGCAAPGKTPDGPIIVKVSATDHSHSMSIV